MEIVLSSASENIFPATFTDTTMSNMDPALRKAWMNEALAELKGRRRMTNTDIARAMGKPRQAFHLAITRETPSEQLVYDMAQAFPDLPRPGETKVIHMNREATEDVMLRLERAVNGLLATQAILIERIERLLVDDK